MVLLTFAPAVEQSNDRTGMAAFIGFIVTFFPLVAIQMLMHPVVRLAIHVGSVSAFRDPNIIHEVLRDQKAEKAVELLTTLHSLRMQFVASKEEHGSSASREAAASQYHMTPDEEAHLEAIGTTFDIYDTDGGGELDVKGEMYEQKS